MTRAATAMSLARVYLLAKEYVLRSGFHSEIDWQEERSIDKVCETDFLRETAWVVLSAGFRERVLRNRFGLVSEAFLDWRSAKEICDALPNCRTRALAAFNHTQKIDAILSTVRLCNEMGFPAIKQKIQAGGVDFLNQLAFIGPITSFHLAKNLGLPVVKPDRHLVRAASAAGYDCPISMCEAIASMVAEKLPVVDVVIWRYATLNPEYEEWFARAARH